MASFLDRLLGRTEPEPAKATIGAGVYALTWDTPLEALARDPAKLAKQAQRLYRSNPWVRSAERAIVSRAASVGYHLESGQGVTLESHPALDLLQNPSPLQFGPIPEVGRKRMWTLTLRHAGLVGYTFWYLDQLDGNGVPRELLYINPARMKAAEDKAGNLIGWVMDGDREEGRRPVAFRTDEILPFIFDPDDDGHLGIGLVESAISKIRLSEKADSHAAKTAASGGRKPGIIMPAAEQGTFNEEQYAQIVRELRNVTDSPDATKKSLIFKARVDYTDAGTTPEQLQLADMMRLSREDIFGIWHVPLSQAGFAGPTGLNSGEKIKYDEAEIWQGPIKTRLDMFKDTVQSGLLDRYPDQPELEMHVPTFDDKAPAYEIAKNAANLPLTRNERRAQVGLPPLPDLDGLGQALGTVIDLPTLIAQVAVVPTESDTSGDIEEGGEIKARLDVKRPLLGLRRRTEATYLPRIRRAVAGLLAEQRAEIAGKVKARHVRLSSKPADSTQWWNASKWERRWREVLEPELAEMGGQVGRRATSTLKRQGKADDYLDRVLTLIRDKAATRVKGINDTTRDEIQRVIVQGVEDGLGASELADLVSTATAFDEARSEVIARTETAYAYNDAAMGSYREFDVTEVEVIDGDGDEECADADGQIWSLEEAEGNEIAHPNCVRDFIPVTA